MDPVLRALLARVGTIDGTRFSVRRTVVHPIRIWILSVDVTLDIEFVWLLDLGLASIHVHSARF